MRLRIIAGMRGGRFIDAPPGRATRPTPERVREAWFAAVGGAIRGARVIDLFAGSGALGIEALSRGARHAHFVESNRAAVDVIRRNLATLDLAARGTVVRRDAFAFLASTDETWDIGFADPPYRGDEAERITRRFREAPFAECLWLEHDARQPGPDPDPTWSRTYGDTRLSRFERRSEAKGEGGE